MKRHVSAGLAILVALASSSCDTRKDFIRENDEKQCLENLALLQAAKAKQNDPKNDGKNDIASYVAKEIESYRSKLPDTTKLTDDVDALQLTSFDMVLKMDLLRELQKLVISHMGYVSGDQAKKAAELKEMDSFLFQIAELYVNYLDAHGVIYSKLLEAEKAESLKTLKEDLDMQREEQKWDDMIDKLKRYSPRPEQRHPPRNIYGPDNMKI